MSRYTTLIPLATIGAGICALPLLFWFFSLLYMNDGGNLPAEQLPYRLALLISALAGAVVIPFFANSTNFAQSIIATALYAIVSLPVMTIFILYSGDLSTSIIKYAVLTLGFVIYCTVIYFGLRPLTSVLVKRTIIFSLQITVPLLIWLFKDSLIWY